jgi:hypothetical protein
MANQHFDITIKIGLTADQFLFIRDEAEAKGLSVSALVRNMIANLQRAQAMKSLSAAHPAADMAEVSRHWA